MKVIVTGGGTGGHINPAIAIAGEISRRDKNNKVLFIGTNRGLEKRLVPEAGYDIEFVDVEGLKRRNKLQNISVLSKFAFGILRCLKIISKFKPDVVVGTGGYVSAPAVIAASILKIPSVIHEQNAIAGKTSKLLSKYAKKICVTFDNKEMFGCPDKTVVTGNPVRDIFKSVTKIASRNELGFDSGQPLIVCVSGSLGAQKINDCIVDFIIAHHKKNKFSIVVVTGDFYYEEVIKKLHKNGVDTENKNIRIKSYVNNIEKYLSAADLVISRSGATFLSEIAYLGKPSLLIPSPNVAENHQELNADVFVKKDAAVKITEAELTESVFENILCELINDKYKLNMMGHNARSISVVNSTSVIADEIESLIKK